MVAAKIRGVLKDAFLNEMEDGRGGEGGDEGVVHLGLDAGVPRRAQTIVTTRLNNIFTETIAKNGLRAPRKGFDGTLQIDYDSGGDPMGRGEGGGGAGGEGGTEGRFILKRTA